MIDKSFSTAVVLFAYNRSGHLSRTLEALKHNRRAEELPLYIVIDGPKSDDDKEKVERVKLMAEQFDWPGEKHLSSSELNLGLRQSVIKGCSHLFIQYGRLIVLEDDILTGKGFLDYMLQGLDTYESSPRVYGLSGYSFHSSAKLPSTYFLPIASSWGWATWKDRWESMDFNPESAQRLIKGSERKMEFDFGGYPYSQMLNAQFTSAGNSWAILFYANMFLMKGLFLFPNHSLVENIGHDHSGTHGVSQYGFTTSKRNDDCLFTQIEAKVDPQISAQVERAFKSDLSPSVWSRLVAAIAKRST